MREILFKKRKVNKACDECNDKKAEILVRIKSPGLKTKDYLCWECFESLLKKNVRW